MANEVITIDSTDEQIASALFDDLNDAKTRDVLPLSMVRRREAIAMYYVRGNIALATYDAAEDVLSTDHITPEAAVAFLSPEGTRASRITAVGDALAGLIAADLEANATRYANEREEVSRRMFRLPLADDDEERMRSMLTEQGVRDVDLIIEGMKGFGK
ncbi:hypothetical protein KC973_03155 [Candidatus Saccharibacteria bacterium]|nr:hypothetical protein [Candidatus Saccharibacteria bacterium]